jgi:hypothetical protein
VKSWRVLHERIGVVVRLPTGLGQPGQVCGERAVVEGPRDASGPAGRFDSGTLA